MEEAGKNPEYRAHIAKVNTQRMCMDVLGWFETHPKIESVSWLMRGSAAAWVSTTGEGEEENEALEDWCSDRAHEIEEWLDNLGRDLPGCNTKVFFALMARTLTRSAVHSQIGAAYDGVFGEGMWLQETALAEQRRLGRMFGASAETGSPAAKTSLRL